MYIIQSAGWANISYWPCSYLVQGSYPRNCNRRPCDSFYDIASSLPTTQSSFLLWWWIFWQTRYFILTVPIETEDCNMLIVLAWKLSVNYSPPKLVILHMNMALHVYDDIMRMTENLSEKYIIGYGASSTVYKCVLKNCKPVAIKKLYSHYPQYLKEFETELETVGSVKHRNLVSLQGYSLSTYGNLLFYDYMENGSLWDLLHGKFKPWLERCWCTLLKTFLYNLLCTFNLALI